MHIRTLSATRIKSYEGCPKRMLAEMAVKTSSKPGDFGSALHAALEWFHKLTGEGEVAYNWDELCVIWHHVCAKYLGWMDDKDEVGYLYVGERLLAGYLDEHPEPPEIISQEVREEFTITTPDGTEIGITYIMDRLDKHPTYGYSIIDYKSQYGRMSPDDMRKATQPFLYACAVRRKYGVTGDIPVVFVMLRQDPQDVGIIVTQADMDRFEAYLADVAQQILDDDDPREKLNAECGYCIRKSVCGAWQKAIEAGWAPTMDLPDLAAKLAEAKYAEKCAKELAGEINEVVLAKMKEAHLYEVEAGDYDIKVTLPKTGAYDPIGVHRILGDEAMPYMKVGKTALDKEVNRKGAGKFTEEEKAELRNTLSYTDGAPGIKIEKRG
ncbi:MAG: PD-(D/E)XK nuclease family protein [Pseudomonadota bacterium]|nr:PD-(D/E)XK nuclease family protein [Pseudomonadota bacterium]